MKNIIFMGTPKYAKDILETLILDQNFNIVLVLTQPDRPFGRKKILKESEVKISAKKFNLNLLQPDNLKNEIIYKTILNKKPDFIIVSAFGQILPKNILNIAPCINLHASILPKYRGASPIQESILNMDKWSGVTAILMNEGLDTGDILGFRYLEISEKIDITELTKKLTELASILTLYILKNFSFLEQIKQNQIESTYCKKIKKIDGMIKFESAKKLYSKYRAFKIWPNIFLENGLKLTNIELIEDKNIYKMGEILSINKNFIIVGCLIGSIKIIKIQAPSKKEIFSDIYCLGKKIKIGNILY